MGRYVLTPGIFDKIDETEPGVGGEIQLTDALQKLDSITTGATSSLTSSTFSSST